MKRFGTLWWKGGLAFQVVFTAGYIVLTMWPSRENGWFLALCSWLFSPLQVLPTSSSRSLWSDLLTFAVTQAYLLLIGACLALIFCALQRRIRKRQVRSSRASDARPVRGLARRALTRISLFSLYGLYLYAGFIWVNSWTLWPAPEHPQQLAPQRPILFLADTTLDPEARALRHGWPQTTKDLLAFLEAVRKHSGPAYEGGVLCVLDDVGRIDPSWGDPPIWSANCCEYAEQALRAGNVEEALRWYSIWSETASSLFEFRTDNVEHPFTSSIRKMAPLLAQHPAHAARADRLLQRHAGALLPPAERIRYMHSLLMRRAETFYRQKASTDAWFTPGYHVYDFGPQFAWLVDQWSPIQRALKGSWPSMTRIHIDRTFERLLEETGERAVSTSFLLEANGYIDSDGGDIYSASSYFLCGDPVAKLLIAGLVPSNWRNVLDWDGSLYAGEKQDIAATRLHLALWRYVKEHEERPPAELRAVIPDYVQPEEAGADGLLTKFCYRTQGADWVVFTTNGVARDRLPRAVTNHPFADLLTNRAYAVYPSVAVP